MCISSQLWATRFSSRYSLWIEWMLKQWTQHSRCPSTNQRQVPGQTGVDSVDTRARKHWLALYTPSHNTATWVFLGATKITWNKTRVNRFLRISRILFRIERLEWTKEPGMYQEVLRWDTREPRVWTQMRAKELICILRTWDTSRSLEVATQVWRPCPDLDSIKSCL